jgi:hypothetical protein
MPLRDCLRIQARAQTELVERWRWTTCLELVNAIFEYLEIFHNRQRRHSALGWRTPLNSRGSTPPTSPGSNSSRSTNGPRPSGPNLRGKANGLGASAESCRVTWGAWTVRGEVR